MLEIITRYNMLARGDRLGVAVSGGADSVALLHILRRLAAPLELSLTVLHCNHGLRGAASDEDEAFVRQLAERLGVGFRSERCEPAAGNLEERARLARRRFWAKAREDLGLARVALGHTRSDQAETVLFRFLRGAGTSGLAGMRRVSNDGLVRPFLDLGRDEIRAWLVSEDLSWREDATNQDVRFRRNQLRLRVMPELQRFNSNLEGVLAGMADVAGAENEYWGTVVERTYSELVERSRFGLRVSAPKLSSLDLAVARRLLRRAAHEIRGHLRGLDCQHIEGILRICGSNHGHDRVICPGLDAMRSFDCLLLSAPGTLSREREYTQALTADGRWTLPHGEGEISLKRVNWESPFCANFKKDPSFSTERVGLDEERLRQADASCSLSIRNWQPGDTIEQAGHSAPQKLKALFQEHRVYLWERKHWPVLVVGSRVVWARGFGCDRQFQATAVSGKVLQLQYVDVSEERRFEARV